MMAAKYVMVMMGGTKAARRPSSVGERGVGGKEREGRGRRDT